MGLHRVRRAVQTLLLAALLMLAGEEAPRPEKRRIRGEPPFMTEKRLELYKMYDESASVAFGEIKKWISDNKVPLPLFASSAEHVKLCVGIITARRVNAHVRYLRQLIAALITRMPFPNKDVYMHIYNVDERPDRHAEIDEIRDWFPVTNVKAPKNEEASEFRQRYTDQIQESFDYAIIIRDMVAKGCPAALLLEDDALPNEHWWEQTLDALGQLKAREKDWFIVRLYVARWRGWYPKPPPKITSYDQGFNTVAILLNGEHMKRFADDMDAAALAYLNGGSFFEAKDIFMGQFKRSTGLSIESFEPGPFQHTGVYSSRGARNIRNFAWYMASKNFESEIKPITFDPSRSTPLIIDEKKLIVPN